MNIQAPLKCLGSVDIKRLVSLLPEPNDRLWDQGAFRNEKLALGAHDPTSNLVRRHEWFNRKGVPDQTLDFAIDEWASSRINNKTYNFSRCKRVGTTALCSVYEFHITRELDEAIDSCADECISYISALGGVITRSVVVSLPPRHSILPHRDGGLTQRFAHRIHVPLIGYEGTVYRIGGRRVTMEGGKAYNFNNRWLHSVENVSEAWRVNLIIDYLEDPEVRNPWARYGWKP
jgi:hypothetical protein